MNKKIRLVNANSILGLSPSGTELLADRFLKAGLAELIDAVPGVVEIRDLNHLYRAERDEDTGCLNTMGIRQFSMDLNEAITTIVNDGNFAMVLGGDCSILIGIMSALKGLGKTGLIFLDAHADFYSPETSASGEVADMDLAIVSGRGPEILTNINDLAPYVDDGNIIHIGQRDQEETKKYKSPEISDTDIYCISAAELKNRGHSNVAASIREKILDSPADYFWIHFDTDVLDDDINPAVDYRLRGGLNIEELQTIIKTIISTGKCYGISITIFNPLLDIDGTICATLVQCITGIFKTNNISFLTLHPPNNLSL